MPLSNCTPSRVSNVPKLSFEPGNHAAVWVLGKRSIAGEFSADPLRPPEIGLFGDVEEKDWSQGVGLPEDHEYERVVGTTRSGHDVVLTDAHISIWSPGRSLGSARHAVVGLGVARVPGHAYSRIRFQMTELDLLFGVAPIKSVSWPGGSAPHLHGQFCVEVNPAADLRWEEDREHGLSVDCTYDIRFSVGNTHRHEVTFAPVISLASRTPLTVDEWVDRWVMPMLRLASLATRKPQRLSWLTVSAAPAGATGQERQRHPSGVVFGSGIAQAPYEAEYRDEWRRPENRPMFTLATIAMSLPDLIRRWATLEREKNPFIELYGQTLRQTDLPRRARFLYLIQALEALHSYQQKAADHEAQVRFEVKRKEVMTALGAVGLPERPLRFIRENWSKRKPDNLDRRLRELLQALPAGVRALLVIPSDNPIATELIDAGDTDLEGQLRVLRNNLSHGTQNYDEVSLQPWVEVAETMCRAHALRVLGFDDDGVESGLAPPPAPTASAAQSARSDDG